MKYAGETYYIVVDEGEIVAVFEDEDKAQGRANYINESNIESEVREAGYDPEELTDKEIGEFAISAGYNNGYAYYEAVTIPEDFDEDNEEDGESETDDYTFYTSEGDEFTYGGVISAISEAIAREELEDNEED